MSEPLTQQVLTASEVAYHLRAFMAMFGKYTYHSDNNFLLPLFYGLATMPVDVARQFCSDVRSTPFQMLPYLIYHNAPMDHTLMGKFHTVSPSYASLDKVMEQLRSNPILRKFSFSNVEFAGSSFVSVGASNDKALNFLKAVALSIDMNNMDALLYDVGEPFRMPWALVNSSKFNDVMEHAYDSPFADLISRIKTTKFALATYVNFDSFSLLLAIYLHIDEIDEKFLVTFGAKLNSDFLQPVAAIAPMYAVGEPEALHDLLQMDNAEGIAGGIDPWNDRKATGLMKRINVAIAVDSSVSSQGVSDDKFARAIASIDTVGEQLRAERDANVDWDVRSQELSTVSDVEPSLGLLNKTLSLFANSDVHVLYAATPASVSGSVVAKYNPCSYFAEPPVVYAKPTVKYKAYSDLVHKAAEVDKFTDGLEFTNNNIVVFDDLDYVVNPFNGRSWLTVSANVKSCLRQLKSLRVILHGDPSSDRVPIRCMPRVIHWRTVSPFHPTLFNLFDDVLVRLGTYYDVYYIPPSKPHEPQFVLHCIRRLEIRDWKFYNPVMLRHETSLDVVARKLHKLPFIIRNVDARRRYYGIIHRDNCFMHRVSLTASKVIRSLVLKLVAKYLVGVIGYNDIKQEFQIQLADFPAADKVDASDQLLAYLGFNTKANKAKSKKKVLDIETNTYRMNMLQTVDAFFGTA